MPAPCPILHVPTHAAKIAALRMAHGIGWTWYDDIDYALSRLAGWSPDRMAETTHLILGGMRNVRGMRSVHWQTSTGLHQLLARPKDYTLVNSLAHLRAYALKHRPKAPPVAPPAPEEIPF